MQDSKVARTAVAPVTVERLIMPNIAALLQGCVSGEYTEWPALRKEVETLVVTLAGAIEAKDTPARVQWGHDPESGEMGYFADGHFVGTGITSAWFWLGLKA